MHTVNDARWKEWADNVLKSEKVPMNAALSAVMTELFFRGNDDPGTNAVTKALAASPTAPGIVRLIATHGLRIGLAATPQLVTMIAVLSNGMPAHAVVYLHTFRRIQQAEGLPVLTAYSACATHYACGFLSRDALYAAWDAQKDPECPCGNYLDAITEAA